MRRRAFTSGLLAMPAVARAQAEQWPDRPITLLQGFGPGGNGDVLARLAAGPLAAALGQPVVVEGRPGAGGNLASDATAKARPDGYTFVMLTGGHTASAAIYNRLPFDPVADFSFIGSWVAFPLAMATRADAPWQNLAQVIAAAKEKPGSITYATSGVGTTQHLAAELLAQTTGIQLNHVPYRGGTAPLPDVLSGRVDLYMDTITTTGPGIRDGKLRGIGVTSPGVWPLLPEAPPMAATVPGFQVMSWAGMAGPPGLPAPIVQRMNAELHKAMAVPEVQARMATLGAIAKPDSPTEFTRLVTDQVRTWRQVVAKAGIERQ